MYPPRMAQDQDNTGIAKGIDTPAQERQALWSHIIPFVVWMAMMIFLDVPAIPPAWGYAVRSVTCLILLFILKPWRWYEPLKIRNLPAALLVGVLVFVIWVGPESAWMEAHAPRLKDLYLRWAVLPFGKLPEPLKKFPFAPEFCGWPLSGIRLAGSAFVIAIIEEFFWRGFLYRWMLGRNFLTVDMGKFDLTMFVVVSVIFGAEHQQWLAGILAGLAYALLIIRTRDIWAGCVAHVVTNLALGVYVLKTGAWHFW